MNYKYLNEISENLKTKVDKVLFFRHQGLYMCHAYRGEQKLFDFYLTERDEFLTKGQARKRLKELFPDAKIELFVVPRSNGIR